MPRKRNTEGLKRYLSFVVPAAIIRTLDGWSNILTDFIGAYISALAAACSGIIMSLFFTNNLSNAGVNGSMYVLVGKDLIKHKTREA